MDAIEPYRKQIEQIGTIISEPDKGLYDALNKGIKKATGDYVGFVHSDDILYDEHVISRVVKQIIKTKCDVFYGDGIFVDEQNTDEVIRNWISGKYDKKKLRRGWLPLHPTMYIKREVYLKRGLYDSSYKIAGDTDLLLRYMKDGDLNCSYLHKPIVRMRMGGMSTSIRGSFKKWEEDCRAYKSNGFRSCIVMGKILIKVPQYLRQLSFYKRVGRKILTKLGLK
jgi:glycosyltransferase